jgi:hypothetical protein
VTAFFVGFGFGFGLAVVVTLGFGLAVDSFERSVIVTFNFCPGSKLSI